MKAAVIGAGRMGRRHIQVVQKMGLELCGVYDVSRESLRLAHEEQSVPESRLFENLDRLYADGRPDCVVIATTADSHCALACMAAERGATSILVEKPMAVSLEQCDRIVETCARLGARLAVNHQMRFMPQYTEPKRLAGTEAYGGLKTMTVVAGNFGFSMVGTHLFEAFRFATDERPVEATAWFSPEVVANPRGSRFQDRAGSIRVVTASGKRLYIEAGADQGHGIRVIYGCRNGTLAVDGLNGEIISSVREEQHRDLPTTRYGTPAINTQWTIPPAEVIDSTAAVLTALFEGVNNVSGEDGRLAVEVLVAAYASSERGGIPVRVDAALDRTRTYPWA